MKTPIFAFFAAIVLITAGNSCTKTETETIIKTVTDTLTLTVRDTLLARSVDTVVQLKAVNFTAYSYLTENLVDSGSSTFQTTAEGVRVQGQTSRYGLRLQTKSEFGFYNRNVYLKWRVNGGNQFSGIVPAVKYDITENDGDPDIQGVDLDYFSTNNTFNNSVLVQQNEWYYTRWVPVPGTDNYTIITARGNYHHLGGTVVSSKTVPIYTKSGYLAIRLGDPFAGAGASLVLGECRINKN
jgi:hypothetical protein